MKPGQVDFVSQEIEWLLAHLLPIEKIAIEFGEMKHPVAKRLVSIIDKLERARFSQRKPISVIDQDMALGARLILERVGTAHDD